MRIFDLPVLMVSLTLSAWAQAAPAGLPPEWETRKLLTTLVETAKRLDPVLGQLDPAAWKAQGAPDTYGLQWKNTRQALEYLQWSADRFSKDPNRVSYAMDTYFRLQNIEQLLGSLSEGVRKYQNPAIADLLTGIANENAASRDALRQYLVDLAAVREAEMQVIDSEAQRCRSAISRQAPATPPSKPAPRKEKN